MPDPIFHLALAGEWARGAEAYCGSTLGHSLAEVGFVHCSHAWQVPGIADAVYRGRDDVVLLRIDPSLVGSEVRLEGGYPHVYGPVPTDAVVSAAAVPLGADDGLRLDGLLPDPLPGWTWADLAAAEVAAQRVPPDVDEVHTGQVAVLRWPDHATSPTFGAVHAHPEPGRSLADLRPAVDDAARAWGATEVWWWSRGPGLDAALHEAGASLALTQRVVVRDLTDAAGASWMAEPDAPGVTVAVVDDWDLALAMDDVQTAGWRRAPTPPDARAAGWSRLVEDLDMHRAWRLLGSVDGTPASVGACRIVPLPELPDRGGGAALARLDGAVTLAAHRGRGLYRAVVRARCRIGRTHGAGLALTHARLETSAPTLERLGFVTVGEERCWVLPVTG